MLSGVSPVMSNEWLIFVNSRNAMVSEGGEDQKEEHRARMRSHE